MLLLIILLIAAILYLLFKKKSQKNVSTEGHLSRTNKEINDAIRYSSLLDDASSLKLDELPSFFDDSFSVSHPKNIKSSTYAYFVKLSHDKGLLAIIDARGKSIDSILNALFVKRILQKIIDLVKEGTLDADPAKILVSMERELQYQFENVNDDKRPGNIGFDAAVVVVDLAANKLLYAGANIPLFYTQNHEVTIVRADKHSIGSGTIDYKNHTIKIIDTTNFYLLTSGYIDQIGGNQELPIGKRRVKEILGKYELQNMDTQRNALVKAYKTYKGKYPMVGDITMIGFQITAK
jgi:serine phosphatase RsbU (regulator of sigma subunit)